MAVKNKGQETEEKNYYQQHMSVLYPLKRVQNMVGTSSKGSQPSSKAKIGLKQARQPIGESRNHSTGIELAQ